VLVGVGVLVHNRRSVVERLVPQLLGDLAASTQFLRPAGYDVHVVLLDNASEDGSTEFVASLDGLVCEGLHVTALLNRKNEGVFAYNRIFQELFGRGERGYFVEADSNIILRSVDHTLPTMLAVYCWATKEGGLTNLGFLGLDYYIPIASRDTEIWKGAKSFATSSTFYDEGSVQLLAVEEETLQPFFSEAARQQLFVYEQGSKGLAFGGFRLCSTAVWRAIGGQPEFKYGTDRYMNQAAWREGFATANLLSTNLEKVMAGDSEQYRRWKREYLRRNVIARGKKEQWS